MTSDVLIAGCGYLGKVLASRMLANHLRVAAITRHQQNVPSLQDLGCNAAAVDLAKTTELPPELASPRYVAVMLPPGQLTPEGHYSAQDALLNLISALDSSSVKKGILVSSTAVYGNQQRRTVSADSPVNLDEAKSRALYALEQIWFSAPFSTRVVRLSGLYGPGRIIGLRSLQQDGVIPGRREDLLNLIHVDDAAALVFTMLTCVGSAHIELGSDGQPVSRGEYYEYLARKLGKDVFFTNLTGTSKEASRVRERTSKSCDIGPTCKRTGWTPLYSNYKLGLETLFTQQK